MRIDLPKHFAWISHSHHIGRNILSHNAARADDCIIPNTNTGYDNGACADPAVAPDMYRSIILIDQLPQLGQYGMPGSGNGYIGAEHRIIAHINMGIIHQCQIKI